MKNHNYFRLSLIAGFVRTIICTRYMKASRAATPYHYQDSNHE